ncbi:hypothetical protein BD779DRAFT_574564 [Infundibulicybe gibba]|nr:hypothetical protein BD779DRAFT_574564 [Infundibulicybe gibba]
MVAGIDILIAVSTCWYLVRKRNSGLKSTRRLVNRIILRIVQTGVATSVLALCVLILFVASRSSAWLGPYLVLTPLYPIALLALLNGRMRFEGSSTIQTIELSLESRVQVDNDAASAKSPTSG